MTTDDRSRDELAETLELSINILRLQPGDTLVIRVPENTDPESARYIMHEARAAIERASVPHTGVMGFAGDVQLSIIRPDTEGRTPDGAIECGRQIEHDGVLYRCDKRFDHIANGEPSHYGLPVGGIGQAQAKARQWWFDR